MLLLFVIFVCYYVSCVWSSPLASVPLHVLNFPDPFGPAFQGSRLRPAVFLGCGQMGSTLMGPLQK